MKSITAATLTTLSLLSTCWIHPVLALRNVRQNIEDGVVQQQRQGKCFLMNFKPSHDWNLQLTNILLSALLCDAIYIKRPTATFQHHHLQI
jgi:hypothetical protein